MWVPTKPHGGPLRPAPVSADPRWPGPGSADGTVNGTAGAPETAQLAPASADPKRKPLSKLVAY